MESIPLKQSVALVVDTMGMKGPVERRVAAERVYADTPDDYWSSSDMREARIQYIQQAVTHYMNAPLGEADAATITQRVPPEHRALFDKLPRYICISTRGGRSAQHVMTWRATVDDWEANISLKSYVTERADLSTRRSRNVRDLLESAGAKSLEELFGRITA